MRHILLCVLDPSNEYFFRKNAKLKNPILIEEGLFIAFVDASIADDFLEALHKDEHGANAKIIGTVTKEHPKQVIMESAIGGKRVVSMLPGEQLPRIC